MEEGRHRGAVPLQEPQEGDRAVQTEVREPAGARAGRDRRGSVRGAGRARRGAAAARSRAPAARRRRPHDRGRRSRRRGGRDARVKRDGGWHRSPLGVIRRTFEAAYEDNIPFLASALSFDLLLTALPFVVLLLAAVGYLVHHQITTHQIAVHEVLNPILPLAG